MKLVFLDETGGVDDQGPALRTCAACGERCRASVSHGHWHITASMVADGAMTGALFLKYVQES
jgi:hypothetical protein